MLVTSNYQVVLYGVQRLFECNSGIRLYQLLLLILGVLDLSRSRYCIWSLVASILDVTKGELYGEMLGSTMEEDGTPITFRMKTKFRIAKNKCWKVALSSNGSFCLLRYPNEVIPIREVR